MNLLTDNNPITSNGHYVFQPAYDLAREYRVVVGKNPTTWDSGSVTVSQGGLTFSGLSGVTSITGKVITVEPGENIYFSASGGGGSMSITVSMHPVVGS